MQANGYRPGRKEEYLGTKQKQESKAPGFDADTASIQRHVSAIEQDLYAKQGVSIIVPWLKLVPVDYLCFFSETWPLVEDLPLLSHFHVNNSIYRLRCLLLPSNCPVKERQAGKEERWEDK